MLARCSWDNHESFEFRAKTLAEMAQKTQDVLFKERVLSLLSHVLFTEALSKIKDKNKDASSLFLQAYTCGLHGLQDENTLNVVNPALFLWIDNAKMNKSDHSQLTKNLLECNETQAAKAAQAKAQPVKAASVTSTSMDLTGLDDDEGDIDMEIATAASLSFS